MRTDHVHHQETSFTADVLTGSRGDARFAVSGIDDSRNDGASGDELRHTPRRLSTFRTAQSWTDGLRRPKAPDFEFTPILKPLEPFRQYVNVVSGLGHKAADSTAVHSLSPTTWLSGVRPKPTQGPDAYAGITADQIAAQNIGQDTLLPSMELATEDHSGLIGECDRDYGCIYMNTLSWRTPTTPLPMEINPRKVFERMFGQGSNAAERVMRKQQDRSILDGFMQQAADLQKKLGARDRTTVNDYLDSVREIERRIQTPGIEQTACRNHRTAVARRNSVFLRRPRQDDVRPAGSGVSGQRHARHHVHGRARNQQSHVSAGRSVGRSSRDIASSESRGEDGQERQDPDVSHRLFSQFLEKMRTTRDGDGSLLDHSVILYGSNMSNSNAHNHFPLPNLVVGGAIGTLERKSSPEVSGSHSDDESSGVGAGQGRR